MNQLAQILCVSLIAPCPVSQCGNWLAAGGNKKTLISAQSGWPRNLDSALSLAVKSSVNKKGVLLGQPQNWRDKLHALLPVLCALKGSAV